MPSPIDYLEGRVQLTTESDNSRTASSPIPALPPKPDFLVASPYSNLTVPFAASTLAAPSIASGVPSPPSEPPPVPTSRPLLPPAEPLPVPRTSNRASSFSISRLKDRPPPLTPKPSSLPTSDYQLAQPLPDTPEQPTLIEAAPAIPARPTASKSAGEGVVESSSASSVAVASPRPKVKPPPLTPKPTRTATKAMNDGTAPAVSTTHCQPDIPNSLAQALLELQEYAADSSDQRPAGPTNTNPFLDA